MARDESERLPDEWVKGVDAWDLARLGAKEGEGEQEIFSRLRRSAIGDQTPTALRCYCEIRLTFMFALVLSWGQA